MNKTPVILLLFLAMNLVVAQDQTYFHQTIADFQLDPETGIDPTAWSAVEKIDGKSCRRLLSGKKGRLVLPIWWQETQRPAAGRNARAEIEFKDTTKTPIRVNLHAGLPGEIEIHRIGGLGDNTWKTAHIPVPWDQIIRINDTAYTALSLSSDSDVPMHAIRIQTADPANDERRWAAETRAWIARAQADKRGHAQLAPCTNICAHRTGRHTTGGALRAPNGEFNLPKLSTSDR